MGDGITQEQAQQMIDLLTVQGQLLALLPQVVTYLAVIFRSLEILIVIAAIAAVSVPFLLRPRSD